MAKAQPVVDEQIQKAALRLAAALNVSEPPLHPPGGEPDRGLQGATL